MLERVAAAKNTEVTASTGKRRDKNEEAEKKVRDQMNLKPRLA